MASPPFTDPVPGASSPGTARPRMVSEVAIQKITEMITCPVCFETFLEPKTIPGCLHVLCLACLERAAARSRENLTCPMCRKPVEVPEGGVAALQTAYHVNNLIEVHEALRSVQSLDGARGEQEDGAPAAAPATCSKCPGSKAEYFCPQCSHFLCQDCRKVHRKWPEFSSHVPSSLTGGMSAGQPSAPISQVCIRHNSERLTHYCLDCKVLMCVSCARAVEHGGHAHSNINELVHRCKDTIVACLEPVRLQLGSLKGAMERVRCKVTHVTQQAADVKEHIDSEIERMQSALEDRRIQLNEEVDRLADGKLQTLHTQEEVLEAAKGQLSDYLKVINHGLQRGSAQQVISMRQAVEERATKISLVFSQLSRSPVEEANIGTFFGKEGGATCGGVGMVYSTSITASKCRVVGRGLRWVVVGEEASVTVAITKDECKDGQFDSFKLELSVDNGHVVVTRQEIREEEREIQIYYILLTKGEHVLHIMLYGGEVSDSPFGVRALLPLQFRGTIVTAITGLRRPWGLSVTSSGELVVVDNQGFDGIHIFSPSGSKLKSFASQAFAPSLVLPEGKCYEPRGVTVTKDGNILLVDGKGHRVQRFSSDGRSVFVIGSLGKCCLEFNDPVGIAVAPSGNVLVCDRRNHRVQVLTPHLTYIREVGQLGTGEADLSLPYDVACDSEGCIYVADCGNYCVKVFSPEGTFLKKIGAQGDERGHFQFITSICIDRNDRLYVLDKERACVTVFDPNGEFRMQFGTIGQMWGQFIQPMGITVDSDGLVYVSDGYSPGMRSFGRVQIFK